ncbi:MAG TPA: hypothetical protein VE685_27170 [Thermoanaerobaculia bacterium]|nr:hypothetical protein [Thermoanaerobaculia bacterium]
MIRPSPRRAAAALALACLALLPPAAVHAAPRQGKAATAFERSAAGPLSGLLDRLAALLRPGGAVSKRGSSLDPDGSTSDSGSKLDPNGAPSEDDRGSGLDPDGRT